MSKPKTLRTDYENMFVEEFGEDIGKKIYRFYYNKVSMSGVSNPTKENSLGRRRLKHAKHLSSTYGIPAVLNAIEVFEERLRTGVLGGKSMLYFEKLVESDTAKEPAPKEIVKTSIPSKNERLFDHYDNELLNWNFKCNSCGEIVDPWHEKCPKCKTWFDWDNIKLGDHSE